MLTLRPYQEEAIAGIDAYLYGKAGNAPLCVIPTGGGKSFIMAEFIRRLFARRPNSKVQVIAHVKELIGQNYQEMIDLWPGAPAGIYSAGLGRRDLNAKILFAGIQSIHTKASQIGQCDALLIDEAHLVPAKSATLYRRYLTDLLIQNPNLKILGFTATPFRLDSGWLYTGDDALFDGMAYEVSVRDLIHDGFLSPVVPKKTKLLLDTAGVKMAGGEFVGKSLEDAINVDRVTQLAIDEAIAFGHDRQSWLFFCAGVAHANAVSAALSSRGIYCPAITGETKNRGDILDQFTNQKIRALAAMNVLTTGFNAKSVDLIAMLRPTKSASLYVQMVGRGTRLFPGKKNCLVLDFARNVQEHGPIDLVRGRDRVKGKRKQMSDPAAKACPICSTLHAIAARRCSECDHEFPAPVVKIEATADTRDLVSENGYKQERVESVTYTLHEKYGKPDSIKVSYWTGKKTIPEWIHPEGNSFMRRKSDFWWNLRRKDPLDELPDSTPATLRVIADKLQAPTTISISESGKYPEVISVSFEQL